MLFRGIRSHLIVMALALSAFLGVMAQPSVSAQEAEEAEEIYRIVILEEQPLDQAQRLKDLLENLEYRPVILERQDEGYRVLYGYFSDRGQAEQAKAELQEEGISSGEIIQLNKVDAAPVTPRGIVYTVLLREFSNQQDAQTFRRRLEADPSDYSPIMTRQLGRFYQVYVGAGSFRDASLLLGKLRQEGYTVEGVSKVVIAPADLREETEAAQRRRTPPARAEQPAQAQQSVDGEAAGALSPAITQTELWRSLSEEQKRQVINSVMMQEEIRSGNAVAQQVLDIEKRLKNLDERVRDIVDRIQEEEEVERELRERMNELFTQAENQIRSRQYQEAVMTYRQILDLDPENIFNQHQYVQRRIEYLQSRLEGEMFPGETEALEERKQTLVDEAEVLARSQTVDDLEQAREIWREIKTLNPELYGNEANNRINQLTSRINELRAATIAQQNQAEEQTYLIIMVLAGGVALLLLAVIIIGIRGRSKHKELMRKVSEITSIRPMREIDSTHAPLLETGGASATESDIFTPQVPSDKKKKEKKGGEVSEEEMIDPLGGLAGEEGPGDETPTMDFDEDIFGAGGQEDVFGEEPEAEEEEEPETKKEPSAKAEETSAALDLDAFFSDTGEEEPKAEAEPEVESEPAVEPEPAAAEAKAGGDEEEEEDIDNIFGSLFDEEEESKPEAAPSAAAPEQEPQAEEAEPEFSTPGEPDEAEEQTGGNEEELSPIAFGPGSEETGEETPDLEENEDLLALFDSTIGIAGASGAAQEESDEERPQSQIETEASPESANELGLSTVKLDTGDESEVKSPKTETGLDFEAGEEESPEGDSTHTAINPPSETLEGEKPPVTANGGIRLDFEQEATGDKPEGWEGDYDYARLVVGDETPPRDSQQYLVFEKKEGNQGKAHYSRSFPEVSGKLVIEFDMRCNEKNKFLLGFYVEKDGDFQKSIHTKILRSEAQTTPTIHMQGEAAPYLLGSWAHIKYVVDLENGVLDSYLDNTHVGHEVPIEPNPGAVNTLSIRDNIQTTGTLLLDNIKIYPLES